MRLILITICKLVFILSAQAQNHQEIKRYFGKSYQKALQYLQKNKAMLRKHLPPNPQEAAFVLSIGFPELLRFHALQNSLETAFLEVLYVRKGTAYANFSVGRFQMKPSFAETLEGYIKNNLRLNAPKIYLYKVKETSNIRKARIKRLNNLGWQLKYLQCLYKALNHRYARTKFKSHLQKLRFFASAYNYGFLNSYARINNWSKIKAFPHGKNSTRKQLNYSIIAADFYWNEGMKLVR